MTFKQIIKDEIIGNRHTYKEYFLASALSVVIIFMSLMILYHPQMDMSTLSHNFVNAGKAVTCIVGVFLFFFIYYSEYTFLKHRSKSYALFTILGMKRGQLALLNFSESFSVFAAAFVGGVLFSMLFAKLIFMAFAKLLGIEQMEMYLPWKALGLTAVLFGLIFIVIQLASLLVLHRTQVKDFLQFGRIAQKQKKINIPVAIAGMLLIAAGYYLAATVNDDNILRRIIPVCLIVVVGIYAFYREACPFLLHLISKNKRFYYKGVNMLWVSDLRYRIKDFTTILFLITLTMSVGLTGFTAVFNVATSELDSNMTTDSRYPVVVSHSGAGESSLAGQVQDILDSLQIPFTTTQATVYGIFPGSNVVIPQSALPLFMDADQLAAVSFGQADSLHLGRMRRDVHMDLPLPYQNAIAVKDNVVETYTEGYEELHLTLFTYETRKDFKKDLWQLYEEKQITDKDTLYSPSLFRYFYFTIRRIYLLLSFYFVIIFYLCAGCMLYFKFFNNAVEEGQKYANYAKVGLSNREIRKSSTIQMASVFFLPGIFTVLNTSMAMVALLNTDAPENFIYNTLAIILFTLVIQVVYFLYIRWKYLKLVQYGH